MYFIRLTSLGFARFTAVTTGLHSTEAPAGRLSVQVTQQQDLYFPPLLLLLLLEDPLDLLVHSDGGLLVLGQTAHAGAAAPPPAARHGWTEPLKSTCSTQPRTIKLAAKQPPFRVPFAQTKPCCDLFRHTLAIFIDAVNKNVLHTERGPLN